jgi:hypothetical protein
MKSPISMKNGRWGKFQKMGVLYTHSSKRLGPFSKFPKKKFNKKIYKKKEQFLARSGINSRLAGDCKSPAGPGPPTHDQ